MCESHYGSTAKWCPHYCSPQCKSKIFQSKHQFIKIKYIHIHQGREEYVSELEVRRLASIRRQRQLAHKKKALAKRGQKEESAATAMEVEDENLLDFEVLEKRSRPVQGGLHGVIQIRENQISVITAKDERVKNVSILDLMKSFDSVLKSMCNDVLFTLNDDDWIQVIIKSETHNHHISTILKRKKYFSVQDVLILVQDSVQSSFDMKINEGIFVDIVTVQPRLDEAADILGGTRYRRHFPPHKLAKNLHCMVAICNSDNMCMARSIVVCMGALEKGDVWEQLRQRDSRRTTSQKN